MKLKELQEAKKRSEEEGVSFSNAYNGVVHGGKLASNELAIKQLQGELEQLKKYVYFELTTIKKALKASSHREATQNETKVQPRKAR